MEFEPGPGKGLMTRVWTNGSQWSYLLIQPQYFRGIKYVCLYCALPPSLSLTWKHDSEPVFTCSKHCGMKLDISSWGPVNAAENPQFKKKKLSALH